MPNAPEPESKDSKGHPSFSAELKRRKVVRVAITYAIVAWLIIQVAAATFPGFEIPMWAFRFVVLMLILGFPVALILAWAFELTPEGIKLTKNVSEVEKQSASQAKRKWASIGFAAGVPTLIFGILASVFYFRASKVEAEVMSADEALFEKSIAVLPLVNMSPDPANAYFADGIHDTLLSTLANLGELRVVSRTSVAAYRETDKLVTTIGEELNVAYVMEGSVQREGDQFRLTAQLIRAGSDEHLWAKTFDGALTNVFAVQSQIAREISQSLKAILTPDEATRLAMAPTSNEVAYDLYLQAMALDLRSDDRRQLLEEAVALDTKFTLAWTRLSEFYSNVYGGGGKRTAEIRLASQAALHAALALEPDNPEVIMATGRYLGSVLRDYFLAEREYQRAARLLPRNPELHANLGRYYLYQYRYEESLESFLTAYRLEPSSWLATHLAISYACLRDWETSSRYWLEAMAFGDSPPRRSEAVAIYGDFMLKGEVDSTFLEPLSDEAKAYYYWLSGDADQVLQHAPESMLTDYRPLRPPFGTFRSPAMLVAIAQIVNGQEAEGRLALASLIDKSGAGNEEVKRTIGHPPANILAYAILGEETLVIEGLKQIEESGVKPPFALCDFALAKAWLGRKDEAVAELREVLEVGGDFNIHYLRQSLDFWPLREHAGFQSLLDEYDK